MSSLMTQIGEAVKTKLNEKAPTANPTFTGDVTLNGTGNRIRGDFSNVTVANRTAFQTSTTNAQTSLAVLPNGTGSYADIQLLNNSDISNASIGYLGINGSTEVRLVSTIRGTGTYLPMTFYAGGAERLRIDTLGNILVKSAAGLGYGTGSGGTVTQLTSKSTAVTLNKPTGQITMNNAALAAGASVRFTLNLTPIAPNDNIIINLSSTVGNVDTNYTLSWSVGTNSVNITLKNVSAVSLSEAIVINYSIIKGAQS